MKLKITLSCSVCRHYEDKKVKMPFDCDSVVCPNCGETNSMSIIAVVEDYYYSKDNMLKNLYRIREL